MTPRIGPGGSGEVRFVNTAIARLIGAATGGTPPNMFTTLARHRRLFRRWLRFAGALMPGGKLPRADTELLILRVAHNCGCEYEWRHHERLGRRGRASAPRTSSACARAPPRRAGPPGRRCCCRRPTSCTPTASISDELWAGLRPLLSDAELIELCMLVGHYEMLAMTLNSLAVAARRAARRGRREPCARPQALRERRRTTGGRAR